MSQTTNTRTPVTRNSEILLLFDGERCNLNGDPDTNNEPRIDHGRALVSDVAIKSDVREYLDFLGQGVFVKSQEDGEVLTAGSRFTTLMQAAGLALNPKDKASVLQAKRRFLSTMTDVRLFGALVTIQAEDKAKGKKKSQAAVQEEATDASEKNSEASESADNAQASGSRNSKKDGGSSLKFTGPVQFLWAHSLNTVEILKSRGITSHFSSNDANAQGTIGADPRVKYALMATQGIVNVRYAMEMAESARGTGDDEDPDYREKYGLCEEDLALLDEALVKCFSMSTSHTKFGREAKLYARFEFCDRFTVMGSLMHHLQVSPLDGVQSISSVADYTLSVDKAAPKIKSLAGRIQTVRVWQHPDLCLQAGGRPVTFASFLKETCGLGDKVRALSVPSFPGV